MCATPPWRRSWETPLTEWRCRWGAQTAAGPGKDEGSVLLNRHARTGGVRASAPRAVPCAALSCLAVGQSTSPLSPACLPACRSPFW